MRDKGIAQEGSQAVFGWGKANKHIPGGHAGSHWRAACGLDWEKWGLEYFSLQPALAQTPSSLGTSPEGRFSFFKSPTEKGSEPDQEG